MSLNQLKKGFTRLLIIALIFATSGVFSLMLKPLETQAAAPLPLLLDFNAAGSPTAEGYTGFTPANYNSTVGYGWQNSYGYGTSNQASVSDPLYRDFHVNDFGALEAGSQSIFLVDVPNGSYNVTLYFHYAAYGANGTITVSAEGVQQTVVSGFNVPISRTFTTTVSDGQLTLLLALNGTPLIANGLKVEAVSGGGGGGGTPPPTPPPTDSTPPSIPTNLTATAVSSSQINLSWTASTDNVGVTGYRIYRNNIQIATVTSGTTYSSSGLSPSTTYTYTVEAYDEAGYSSGQTASVNATTQAAAVIPPSSPPPSSSSGSNSEYCNAIASDYAAPAVPAPLRTIYVDAVNGNDSNTGLSPNAAIRTIMPRANSMARPGDLFLLSGTFTGQYLGGPLLSSGTAQNRITFQKMPGSTAVLSGGAGDTVLWLPSKSYLVIDGLEITGAAYTTQITGGSNNIWIRNVYQHHASSMQFIGASNNRVEDSVFEDIGSVSNNTGDGVFIQNNSNNNVIVRNTFRRNGHAAVAISYQGATEAVSDSNIISFNQVNNRYAGGIGINGKAVNTIIECNTIWENGRDNYPNVGSRNGIQLMGTDNTVRYNTIWGTQDNGIDMQAYVFNSFTQNSLRNKVHNNTVWNTGNASVKILAKSDAQTRDNIIENNIFWQVPGLNGGNGQMYQIYADYYHNNSSSNIWTAGNAHGNIVRNNIFPSTGNFLVVVRSAGNGNNLYYDSVSAAQSSFPGWTSNLRVDPMFVDAANFDFRLQATSPAIDVGRNISGISYNGLAVDLGAYESSDSGNPPPPTPPVDSTAPSIPANLVATAVSSSQINLTWQASTDNTGVSGYKIFSCTGSGCTPSSQISTTGNTSFSNTGRSAGTTYRYTVSAYDAAGNESSPSSIVTVTTPAATDTTGPTVSISAPTANASVSGTITITASASDNVGVAGVQFKVNGVNVNGEDTSSPYSITYNTTSISNGTHLITATARDAGGNQTTSATVSVTVNNPVTAAPPTTTTTTTTTTTAGGGGGGGGGGSDTLPPVISKGFPTGQLPLGTGISDLSLSTDENASCKYSLTPNVSFANMTGAFTKTGGLTHQTELSLKDNQRYSYYIKCSDAGGNITQSDYLVTFTVGESATAAPVLEDDSALIAQLKAQILVLIGKIAALRGGSSSASTTTPATSTPAAAFSGSFTQNLTIGSKGAQVTALQQMLIAKGHLRMPPGAAFGTFGPLTRTAVIKWQIANGISPAFGYFGPTSRAKANAGR